MTRSERPNVGQTIARQCLAVRVRMLNRILTGVYDEALRPFGLTASQANLLTAVDQLGPVNHSELASALHIEKSTLSRNLSLMKKRGWLRSLAGDDARRDSVAITAKGAKLLEKAFPSWQQAQRDAIDILGEDGAAALTAVADRYLPAT